MTVYFTDVVVNGKVSFVDSQSRVIKEALSAGITEAQTVEFLAKLVKRINEALSVGDRGSAVISIHINNGKITGRSVKLEIVTIAGKKVLIAL